MSEHWHWSRENWSGDCNHVNVTFMNATWVRISCQQYTTVFEYFLETILVLMCIYCISLLDKNARLREKLKEYDSLQRALLV